MIKLKGFTLVEILTVVMIIAILFVVFVPRINFATTKAREAGIMNDFHEFQIALESVASQHNGFQGFGHTEVQMQP